MVGPKLKEGREKREGGRGMDTRQVEDREGRQRDVIEFTFGQAYACALRSRVPYDGCVENVHS